MTQSKQSKDKLGRACSLCGLHYDPSLSFCPKDGTRLSESLENTARLFQISDIKDSGAQPPASAPSRPSSQPDMTPPPVIPDLELQPVMGAELIGRILADQYLIESIIGNGGMSVVFKAKNLVLKKTVAIKMLLPHLVANESSMQRFQQEAQAASNLNHPNVVTIYNFGMLVNGQPYLVMDYLDGKPLNRLISEDGGVPVRRALNIFVQVADALNAAHSNNIVHRDLKPSNIILGETSDHREKVTIVDFGIAKILHPEGEALKLTQTGEVFGSPVYMSPEQCRADQLDGRSDIYSMGCMMYETLAGKPPISGDNPLEVMYKHLNEVPPPFSAHGVKIPQQLERIIFKTLAKDPAHRYQSIALLHRDLLNCLDEQQWGPLGWLMGRLELLILRRRPRSKYERAATLAACICFLLAALMIGRVGWQYYAAFVAVGNAPKPAWIDTNPVVLKFSDSGEQLGRMMLQKVNRDPIDRVHAAEHMAQLLIDTGKFDQANSTLIEAEKDSIESNGESAIDTADLAYLHLRLCYARGEFDRALIYAQRVIKTYRDNNYKWGKLAETEYMVGNIYQLKNDYIRAEQSYQSALTVWSNVEQSGNFNPRAPMPKYSPGDLFIVCLAKTAELEASKNKLSFAMDKYQQAVDYWNRSMQELSGPAFNSERDSARLRNMQINCAIALDKMATIEEQQAIELKQKGSTDAAARWQQSKQHFQKALDLLANLSQGAAPYIVSMQWDQANALWASGDWLRAIGCYKSALDHYADHT